MLHRTLLHAIAKRAGGKITALDEWIFAADDVSADDHGWQIDRSRRLTRTYRDPRWDRVDEYRAAHTAAGVSAGSTGRWQV